MKYYQVKIIIDRKNTKRYKNINIDVVEYDLDRKTLMNDIIVPFVKNQEFNYKGSLFSSDDIWKLTVLESDISYSKFVDDPTLKQEYFWDWVVSSNHGRDVTNDLFSEERQM